MRMMELSLIGFTLATIWLTIVGILRLLIGSVPTAIASVLGGPLGIVGFAFVETTFYITGLVDGQLGRPVTTGVNDLPPGTGHRLDFRYAIGACLVALLGTIVPITTLLDLWELPVGSGTRPMHLPFVFLFSGCGTPIIAIGFAVMAVRGIGVSHEASSGRWRVWFLGALASLAGFLPGFLTTYGVHWVIQTHSLWLKP